MSITIRQLEELAREYRFDVGEARQFLGIEAKKRGRPTKISTDSDDDTPKKPVVKTSPRAKENKPAAAKPVAAKPVAAKSAAAKRGPSGYNLFVKNQGIQFCEAGKQWKGLSDSAREKWNTKARAM